MKSVFAFLCVTAFFPVAVANASDQSSAVEALISFLGCSGPVLYEGSDELGECRIFLYPQADMKGTQIWLEGTFQKPDSIVLGVTIPFMLSASSDISRLAHFEVNGPVLTASALYPAAEGEVRISIRLEKRENGTLSEVAYDAKGVRVCKNLQRSLGKKR